MIRPAVSELVNLGQLPSEEKADPGLVARYELLLRRIDTPVSDEEARLLVKIFGEDGCFGLAASLVARIETAPSWPIVESLSNTQNCWVAELMERARRGGRLL
jgi:hypothetical protein